MRATLLVCAVAAAAACKGSFGTPPYAAVKADSRTIRRLSVGTRPFELPMLVLWDTGACRLDRGNPPFCRPGPMILTSRSFTDISSSSAPEMMAGGAARIDDSRDVAIPGDSGGDEIVRLERRQKADGE